jgi:hypothetical protein
MSAARFDMYSLVHKGQRKRLFELTMLGGQLASEDDVGRAALVAELEALLASIVDHGEAEDAHLGPLYAQAAPATGERLASEHAALAEALALLRTAATAALTDQMAQTDMTLYRAMARFTAAYLLHTDAEESSLAELWAHYDDAALARAQGALVASHPPATVQFNLRHMLPAASPAERVAFLTNLRRNMPPPAFAGMRGLMGALVPPNEWSQIDAA